ncbi:DUF2809 domain-containing protein [Beijerinckia indica]
MLKSPAMMGKWRPPLALVVTCLLCFAVALPLGGVFFFRIYENQLVRQAEAELIAQSAALAPVIARDIEAALPADTPLGAAAPLATPTQEEPYRPIMPHLDLADKDLLPSRPDARPPTSPPDPALLALGVKILPDLLAIQRTTLAGFRLLDAEGTVIAGRNEIGLSLAHVEEIAAALRGEFRSVMRMRISKHPPPPLYSMSRGTGVRVFTAMPIIVRDHVTAVLYASRTPANVFKNLYEERNKVILASVSVILLTGLAGFVFHRTITRPVRELIARTRAISAGDTAALRPLSHHGTAEFAMLSRSFLDMATSLAHRSAFIATFAAHVSHELKSPLTSIKGAAELLLDDLEANPQTMDDNDRRRFLDHIVVDAARLTDLVSRLRDLARAENTPISGTATLDPVLQELRKQWPHLEINAQGDVHRQARISTENLHIILSHLIDNATHHGAKKVTVEAFADKEILQITIKDDGSGISPNNATKIFEPFFTTRRLEGGTGMGLSIVRAMIEAHSGFIDCLDITTGAAFVLRLPLASGAESLYVTYIGLRLRRFLLCLIVIASGLALRCFGADIGLPVAIVKYGGSILWGAMVFLLAGMILARQSRSQIASIAAVIALVVELSRLYHTPWLDTFRISTAGALLLGRFFSIFNIVAYGAGIILGLLMDKLCERDAARL